MAAIFLGLNVLAMQAKQSLSDMQKLLSIRK